MSLSPSRKSARSELRGREGGLAPAPRAPPDLGVWPWRPILVCRRTQGGAGGAREGRGWGAGDKGARGRLPPPPWQSAPGSSPFQCSRTPKMKPGPPAERPVQAAPSPNRHPLEIRPPVLGSNKSFMPVSTFSANFP